MQPLNLKKISLNLDAISYIEWRDEQAPNEPMPGNTTVLPNPDKVESPKVAIIHFLGGHQSAQTLVIGVDSDDHKTLTQAFKR